MENIICKIEIGSFALDDDYTFYEDGRIHRLYDQSIWKQNISEFIKTDDISNSKKEKIIQKCQPEKLDKITNILFKKDIVI